MRGALEQAVAILLWGCAGEFAESGVEIATVVEAHLLVDTGKRDVGVVVDKATGIFHAELLTP